MPSKWPPGVASRVAHHTKRIKSASKIQKAWRKRRANRNFTRNVQTAVLRGDPVQYRLYGVDRQTVSQAPIVVLNCSNLKASTQVSNAMYLRTSRKIKPLGITFRFRVDMQDAPFNQVCWALVRHKRAEPIVSTDLNNGVGALTTSSDKPFLPLDDGTGYNENITNMTGTSNFAHPSMLLKYFNPKVVDVLKTWTANVQPVTQLPGLQNFPPYKEYDYHHDFKGEIWKYPEIREGATTTPFPYNNKCYSIIGFSDSVTATSHPTLTVSARFSFKDMD